MVLSTVGSDGGPNARTVLLKACDAAGFAFFTNYTSRKGVELAVNPAASLLFPLSAKVASVRPSCTRSSMAS